MAFRYSTGHVSDYILRLLTIPPVPNWQQLKTALFERFSEITDSHIQLLRISNITQFESENIQEFAERILSQCEESYKGLEQHTTLIDHQSVGIFINGLYNDNLRQTLIRANPIKFQQAVELAT